VAVKKGLKANTKKAESEKEKGALDKHTVSQKILKQLLKSYTTVKMSTTLAASLMMFCQIVSL